MNKIFAFLLFACAPLHAGMSVQLQREDAHGAWSHTMKFTTAELIAGEKAAHAEIFKVSPAKLLETMRSNIKHNGIMPELNEVYPGFTEALNQLNSAKKEDVAKCACLFDMHIARIILQKLAMNAPFQDVVEQFREGKIDAETFRLQYGKRQAIEKAIYDFVGEMDDIIGEAAIKVVAEKKLLADYPSYKLTDAEKAEVKSQFSAMPSASETFTFYRAEILKTSGSVASELENYMDAAFINKLDSLIAQRQKASVAMSAGLDYKIDQCILEMAQHAFAQEEQEKQIHRKRMQHQRAFEILIGQHDPRAFAINMFALDVTLKQNAEMISSLTEDLKKRSKK